MFNNNGFGWPYGGRYPIHPGPEGPLTPGPGQTSSGTQDPRETIIDQQNYPNRKPAQPPGGSPPGGSPSSAGEPGQSLVPSGGERDIYGQDVGQGDGDGKRRDHMDNWDNEKKNSQSAKSGKYFVIIRYKYSKTCSVFTTENCRKSQVTLYVGVG